MNEQDHIDFERVRDAITYIYAHFREQPSLEQVAAQVHLSPFHFQRLFTDWAGVSPKKFLQYISVTHARHILQQQAFTLSDAALETGLSGTGRLHDLFVTIEGMSPGTYKSGGAGLHIRYRFGSSSFGQILVASTDKGICHMAFADEPGAALTALQQLFPNASLSREDDAFQAAALRVFNGDWQRPEQIRLYLKGTPFQLKVWETLLKIPAGGLTTYGAIAAHMERPGASRAVGTAVGDNPVAFLIPCHRVIRATGILGEYHWGATRKAAMIGWEAAHYLPGSGTLVTE